MSLKDTLFEALKTAMKEKNTIAKDTIQLVRASILQVEKDKKIIVDDEGVIDIISKHLKQNYDVLPDYQKSGRQDLIDELNQRIQILKSYLPEQLSVDEIKSIILDTISELSATSMKDMGAVMSAVSSKTKGRADNKIISEIIKESLSK